jgi:hypothetical protein
MHILAQPPVLVPREYWREIESLSKAALMDVVWDYATRCVGEQAGPDGIMADIREYARIVANVRKAAKDDK